jgi:hypothetical protein
LVTLGPEEQAPDARANISRNDTCRIFCFKVTMTPSAELIPEATSQGLSGSNEKTATVYLTTAVNCGYLRDGNGAVMLALSMPAAS